MTMRFTIRDLLWLMVVVGLATGWWADHRLTHGELQASTKAFQEKVKLLENKVYWLQKIKSW
jgi:hypothetical protein